MNPRSVLIPYAPRPQMVAFHDRREQNAVIVTHRRYGKTIACINELIKCALTCQKDNPRFAYIAPYRVQAKAIAWDALKKYTEPVPGRIVNETELSVRLPNGAKITLFGADNYEALRGIYLDGAVIDEPEDMQKAVWDYVLQYCLLDRNGWVVWIGTIKGSKGLYKIYERAKTDPNYFTLYLRASQSGVIPAEKLAEAKARNPTAYAREMELDPYAEVAGSIYGPQMALLRQQNRLRPLNADRAYPLDVFMDLGYSDYMSLWCIQFAGRDIVALAYYCSRGKHPSHYVAKMREWEKTFDQPVRQVYVPHDADRMTLGGRTFVMDLKDAGIRNVAVVPVIADKWIGITYMRERFYQLYINTTFCQQTWFDGEEEMPSGVDCLEYYHSKEVNENGIIKDEPAHDAYSHGADALRTMAEAHRLGMAGTGENNRPERVGGVIRGTTDERFAQHGPTVSVRARRGGVIR